MPRFNEKIPSYCLHRPSGQAVVTLDGRDLYLGAHEGPNDWKWRVRPATHGRQAAERFNQLWRNQLLAFSMLSQELPAYEEGYCAALYHPGDVECAEAIAAYQPLLTDTGKTALLTWTLDDVVRRWAQTQLAPDERDWIDAFFLHYLDLSKSHGAWAHFNSG